MVKILNVRVGSTVQPMACCETRWFQVLIIPQSNTLIFLKSPWRKGSALHLCCCESQIVYFEEKIGGRGEMRKNIAYGSCTTTPVAVRFSTTLVLYCQKPCTCPGFQQTAEALYYTVRTVGTLLARRTPRNCFRILLA